MSNSARYRWFIAAVPLIIGLLFVVQGAWLETRNPRTNAQDNLAWTILFVGTFLVGFGISLPHVRITFALIIGLLSPALGFTVLLVLVWGYVLLNAFSQGAFR